MNKKLIDKFNGLSQGEQDILLALSMVFTPIGQTRFQQILTLSDYFSSATTNLIAKPLREKLIKLKMIEITDTGWTCSREISETLMRKAAKKPVSFNAMVNLLTNSAETIFYDRSHLREIKLLRFYLYQQKTSKFIALLTQFKQKHYNYFISALDQLFFHNFDADWFNTLPPALRMDVLQEYQETAHLTLPDCKLQYQLMNSCFKETKKHSPVVIHQYVRLHINRGDNQGMDDLLQDDNSTQAYILMGMLRFMQNRNDESLVYFDIAIKQIKTEDRKRNICLGGLPEYFYNLALLRSYTETNLSTLRKQLKFSAKQPGDYFTLARNRLLLGLSVYQASTKASDSRNELLFQHNNFACDQLVQVLLLYWLGELDKMILSSPNIVKDLNRFCQQADKNGYFWFAAISSNLLERLSATNKTTKEIARKYSESEFNSMIDLLPRIESWQRALDALTRLSGGEALEASNATHNDVRMIWTVFLLNGRAHLTAKEQRIGKSGRWTKGRHVATKRLHENSGEFEYLTEQDRRICSRIEMGYESSYYSYYRKEVYDLSDQAVIEAIGHPHIYWDDASSYDMPVNLSMATLQLLVSEQKGQLLIALSPIPHNKANYLFERTASNDILIYKIEPQIHQVADILGQQGLVVPKSAKQQVIDSISSIASMLTVQSAIGGQSSHAETVEVDSRLHIHLQPVGEGIQIDIFVQPFAQGGPVYKPGSGGATVLAEIDSKPLQTTRDLTQERQYLDQVLESCPGLYHSIDAKWLLDDAEMALEVLLQLQALGDFSVLEWPKGKAIKISRETGFSQVQFSVRKEKDWFSVSGEVQIDDDRVMEIQNLIGLLAATPGRFLKLEDGQIIALTHELRQRLDDLSGLGEAHGENVRFHPLAAQALDDITEGMDVKASKHWKAQLKKLSEMTELDPQLPTTMQGNLRDYQLQGYQWMARLAHLGAGACLADDMGLGKTIQALALILSRATDGPTLILAPTSVCNNWLDEVQRFAPTLNVSYLGSSNRQQLIDDAGPFDLVVCSYGLLQTEVEKLTTKKWHTIVADEAQAIKNVHAKRSKAAMDLQGDFKIITTGTPIENHLGELWNLFNFINPGLLGSLQKFNERYAQKIENQKDRIAQQQLKKLLQPFILRRLKNDVLTELPSRTEVTLHVELSAEERSLYEALRRNAKQTMVDVQEHAAPPGQQHLKVLAEIMKLRRACCHPRLVLAESEISSAKLQAFEELVEELIDNNHKALVFSQFVSHLTLIRELLDKKGINYQYLDGATSMSKRKTAVNAFQSGKGDLFLISLKAGGAGLNLTAADYVVHMDPWWNPAVEDQASDRAHRMGQKRPVTIYRIVAKDTIEDKIVDLHRHKRDLANSLLEGGEVSGKLSVKDMMALIGEID